jgi:hypothetical protein
MELPESFGMPTVFGAVTATAQNKNHRMLPLQIGELPAFRGVVGELVIGEHSPRNNVGSHKFRLPAIFHEASIDG